MLLITIFVEHRVVAGRSLTRAGSPQAISQRPCCAVALRRTAWSGHGMASVNQTRPHHVNQMGKTHSKPLVARHGMGTAWAWHAMCESALNQPHLVEKCSLNMWRTDCSLSTLQSCSTFWRVPVLQPAATHQIKGSLHDVIAIDHSCFVKFQLSSPVLPFHY